MKNILLIFAILFGQSISFAFTLNSSTNSDYKGWANPEIKFQMNLSSCPSGVDVRGIITDAIALWNNVPTSRLKLSIVEDTTSTTFSDPITIICDTNYGSGSAAIADGSPGAASVLPTTGEYTTSGIMYLNASSGRANIANFSRTTVAITLAHEIGHLLGLGHSQELSALMYYNVAYKTNLALAQDDVDAVTYLYPRNELDGDKIAGCGTVANLANIKPPKPPTSGMIMILICILMMPIVTYKSLIRKSKEDFRL